MTVLPKCGNLRSGVEASPLAEDFRRALQFARSSPWPSVTAPAKKLGAHALP
jgi:hypothetical protein